jgi:hypothetical protein
MYNVVNFLWMLLLDATWIRPDDSSFRVSDSHSQQRDSRKRMGRQRQLNLDSDRNEKSTSNKNIKLNYSGSL